MQYVVVRVKSVAKVLQGRGQGTQGPGCEHACASHFARTSTASHWFFLTDQIQAAHVSHRPNYTMLELQSQDDLTALTQRYHEATHASNGLEKQVQGVMDDLDEVRGHDIGLTTRYSCCRRWNKPKQEAHFMRRPCRRYVDGVERQDVCHPPARSRSPSSSSRRVARYPRLRCRTCTGVTIPVHSLPLRRSACMWTTKKPCERCAHVT
jgi:hypothetical protein